MRIWYSSTFSYRIVGFCVGRAGLCDEDVCLHAKITCIKVTRGLVRAIASRVTTFFVFTNTGMPDAFNPSRPPGLLLATDLSPRCGRAPERSPRLAHNAACATLPVPA